jgi:hypothetical protein
MINASIYTLSDHEVTQLSPLPYPVYFITKDVEKWGDLLDKDYLPDDLESVFSRSSTGNDIWSVQTYIQLKRRGLNVHLTSQFVPGQICVAPYHYIAI